MERDVIIAGCRSWFIDRVDRALRRVSKPLNTLLSPFRPNFLTTVNYFTAKKRPKFYYLALLGTEGSNLDPDFRNRNYCKKTQAPTKSFVPFYIQKHLKALKNYMKCQIMHFL